MHVTPEAADQDGWRRDTMPKARAARREPRSGACIDLVRRWTASGRKDPCHLEGDPVLLRQTGDTRLRAELVSDRSR